MGITLVKIKLGCIVYIVKFLGIIIHLMTTLRVRTAYFRTLVIIFGFLRCVVSIGLGVIIAKVSFWPVDV